MVDEEGAGVLEIDGGGQAVAAGEVVQGWAGGGRGMSGVREDE